MRVSVNGQVLDEGLDDGATLGGLLDGLRASGKVPLDEVVVEVKVGQRNWTGAELVERREEVLGDTCEVAIGTDDLRGYSLRILTDVAGMVAVVQKAAGEVARGLREGPVKEANSDLFRLLDAVHQLLVCLYQVQNTCGLQRGLADASEPLLGRVSEALQGMQGHQENEDWQGLAADLEDGLLPALVGIADLIREMKGEL